MATDAVELEVGDRTVRISNPGRVYFPARGETKLDLARYYIAVGDGIVRALRERPCMMHRFPAGVAGEKVHQKRIPGGAPPWLQTVRVDFPRYGRHADELCVTELASVVWAVQMSTVEFHPWNSRRADTERPDEWRIDLDPMPRCGFGVVRRVGLIDHRGNAGLTEARQVCGDLGGGPAVQVGVLGREADVNPRLGQGRDLVVGPIRGLDPGDVDGGAPGLLGGDGVGGQQVGQAALQLDQRIVALPRVRAVAAAANGAQGRGDHALGVGHDPQGA